MHTSPVKKYIDDLTFWFDANGNDCEVVALSVSRPLSIYDYDTNFCNIYNLLYNANFNYTYHIGNEKSGCKFAPPPNEVAATCAKY
jgi:hypothetical protein